MQRKKLKDTTILLRISEIEKTKWKEAAAERGMGTSEFIRFCVNTNVPDDAKKGEA